MNVIDPMLPPDLRAFAEERVRCGDYASVEDVIRDGVKLLKVSREAKLRRLQEAVEVGAGEIDRGEGVDVTWDGLDQWLDGLGRDSKPL